MSPSNLPNCVTKKKSKRAILKTWLHRSDILFDKTDGTFPADNVDSESFFVPNTLSLRSKGQSPPVIYEFTDIPRLLKVVHDKSHFENKIVIKLELSKDNLPANDLENKKYQSLSRRKLGELKESLRANLERITHSRGKLSTHKNSYLDNDEFSVLENTNDTIKTTESEVKEKNSCFQSFRTNPKDLSILFDYAMNTSVGDLQNGDEITKGSISKNPNLFKRLVYEDASEEDILDEINRHSQCTDNDIPSLFNLGDSSSLYSSLYDLDDDSIDTDALCSAGNYPDDYELNYNSLPDMVNASSVLIGNSSQRMKRQHVVDEEQNSKRQRFNLDYDSFFQPPPIESLSSASSSYSEQVNLTEASYSQEDGGNKKDNELNIIRDIEAAQNRQEKSNVKDNEHHNYEEDVTCESGKLSDFLSKTKVVTIESSDKSSTVPSLVTDDKSTSTSRITSDSSQLYTIPTFRNEAKRLNIARIVTCLRSSSQETVRSIYHNPGGINRRASYRDSHFYDSLPETYFADQSNDVNENNSNTEKNGKCYDLSNESDKIYNSIKSIESGYYNTSMNNCPINNDGNSVHFNDESRLLIYTPKRKGPGTLRNDQILLQQQNLDSNATSELKSILKTKNYTKTDIENARAICCDSVNVKSFMKALNDYEEKRLDDDRSNAISRERQLDRYYSKESHCRNNNILLRAQSCGSDI
ncbi:hypothetical protein C6P45_002899 [Maudiozyma exigua]|uniref:Uncharacterized protein n=1 Tax=Maudiozyma exigua TaxID=34358 RepID=A0A9P6VU45_MAUEX|nr:hypothetical protein C6P45_002899 [Kazachstania exigua]